MKYADDIYYLKIFYAILMTMLHHFVCVVMCVLHCVSVTNVLRTDKLWSIWNVLLDPI